MSDEYNCSNPSHKRALIICDGHFHPQTGLQHRRGYLHDLEALRDTFQHLGFITEEYTDITKKDLLEAVKRVAAEDHSKTDCLAVAISSHGGQHELPSPSRDNDPGMEEYACFQSVDIIYATDGSFQFGELLELFNEDNCPTLTGKPKLFFIQSSRGDQLCEAVTVKSGVATSSSKSDKSPSGGDISEEDGKQEPAPEYYSGPKEKIVSRKTDISRDFLAMWSTPPGYVSFHQATGSPFILTLCQVLRSLYQKEDLMTMLTEVTRRVATEFESRTENPSTNGRHMMPSIEHMLRKSVIFSHD